MDAPSSGAAYQRRATHPQAVARLREMLELSGRPLEVHARMRPTSWAVDVTGFALLVHRDGRETPVRHGWLLSAERRGWLRRVVDRPREERVWRLTRDGIRALAS